MNTSTKPKFRSARATVCLSICLYAAMLTACRTKPAIEEAKTPEAKREILAAEKVTVTIPGYTAPTRFEKELGLHARGAGNELLVSVHNKRSGEITVRPQDLGLIVGPRNPEDLVRINASVADMAKAGYLTLASGGTGLLRIPMKNMSAIPGQKLVYYNPVDGIMMSVPVE